MPAIARRVMATLGEPRLRTSQPESHISDTELRLCDLPHAAVADEGGDRVVAESGTDVEGHG